ncbi:MAG: class I adenylate-forming enzyme family protein [Mycobacteriales bacterium]
MNLDLLLDMAADGFGERVVTGRRAAGLTAAELRRLAACGARELLDSDADSVVYLATNGPALPVALFAAALAGVPLVPVNYRLGEEQLDRLLGNHPGAFGIAGTPQEAAALARAGITSRTPDDWLCELADGTELAVVGETGAAAVIIYTSGTTSEPKGVLLHHHNLVSYVLSAVEFGAAGPDDAALVSVPPYHIAAVANVITNLYAGRRTIVLEQFTPVQWLQLVQEEGVTHALVVPTMLARIVDGLDGHQLPSLRTLAYGGAPMPARVIEKAMRSLPHVDFVNAYGLTETSSTISVLGPDDHREAVASSDPAVRARLSSAGRVVPAIELEIRGPSDELLPAGVVGRIWVRGAQVSAEYAGTGPRLDERGFFDTRDEGYLDADGYLFIGGRADDTIIRGGENVAPAEIEDVLLRHEAVADAVVVGIPDEEWGQRIEAAVVLRTGVSEAELRDHVRAALRGSKTPDRVVFWDALPRTETGKLVRRQAAERLRAELWV